MKKLIPVLITIGFASTSLNADSIYGNSSNNDDLYHGGENVLPLAVQPGTGDAYGGSVFDHTLLEGLVKGQQVRKSVDIYHGSADGNIDIQ